MTGPWTHEQLYQPPSRSTDLTSPLHPNDGSAQSPTAPSLAPVQAGRGSPHSPSFPSASTAVTEVTAFLVGLHPSLAPLAPALVAAGFDSLQSLVALVLLEPSTLDATLELVRCGRGKGQPPFVDHSTCQVSVIQLKLLSRLLKETGVWFRQARSDP